MYYRIKPFFVKFFGTFSVNSGVIVGNFYSEEGMKPPPWELPKQMILKI